MVRRLMPEVVHNQQLADTMAEVGRLAAALAQGQKERDEVRDFLERQGYRRCDIPACNCPFWHGGHAMDRLREIEEVLRDADSMGGTIRAGVIALRERAELAESRLSALTQRAEGLESAMKEIVMVAMVACNTGSSALKGCAQIANLASAALTPTQEPQP